jgi:hypothetical protein
MKLKIVDYIFLIVYIVILFLSLLLTPATMVGGTGNVAEESTPIWSGIFLILLYALGVPMIYILIRWYFYKIKKTA